jgi:Zn-dependent peptidase ImmA (M78 family)
MVEGDKIPTELIYMRPVVELLQASHLSASEIASRSKLRLDRVLAILEGAPVSVKELRALSKGLNMPLQNFLAGSSLLDRDADFKALFRSEPSIDGGAYPPTVEYLADYIQTCLSLLPARRGVPDWLLRFQMRDETFLEAHRLAHEFRATFLSDRVDGPLNDLPAVLESLGGVVLGRLRKSKYEGASVLTGGYCFVFVSPRFLGRMLFTLAHEIGHLIAHHQAGVAATFDKASAIGLSRQVSRAESFVNAFAAILLMPDRGVGQTLQVIRKEMNIASTMIGDVEVNLLARFYGVSFDVAAMRCEQLELLPRGGASALSKYVRAEHGSAEKRAQELGLPARSPVEFPKVSLSVLRAVEPRLERGEVSVSWLANRLGLGVNDIFESRRRSERDDETRH